VLFINVYLFDTFQLQSDIVAHKNITFDDCVLEFLATLIKYGHTEYIELVSNFVAYLIN
jgi:hypothetical protein